MRHTRLLISFVTILAMSSALWVNYTFAMGTDETLTPDQNQETTPDSEESDNSSNTSGNAPIGGGSNADNEQESAPDKPEEPEIPTITQPVPQPEDTDVAPSTPDTKPSTQAPVVPPVQTPQPNISGNTSSSNQTPVNGFAQPESDQPVVTEDSIEAESTIDVPQTGLTEIISSTFNPFAFAMLVLAGITIASAGVIVVLLGKAARREREIL